jgi:hypothetical protein
VMAAVLGIGRDMGMNPQGAGARSENLTRNSRWG